MGRCVIVYGKSGSGKSRSLKNFGENEIFLANVTSKDLPFRKNFKYSCKLDVSSAIINGLRKMPTNVAVIDDATFIMVNAFMRGHGGKTNQFDLYNNIADSMFAIFEETAKLPDDVIVYVILHENENDNGLIKLKTIGKLLDDKCPMESLVTVCLRCMTDGTRYYFRTQSDGFDISKSPEDMFDLEIDNDLAMVDNTIREYYGLEPRKQVIK
jgi:hypothetical protein